jgi:hypothetical protein
VGREEALMNKILLLTLVFTVACGVAAWAEDDGWDDWDAAWAEFNGETHSSEVAERTLRASQPIYRNVMQEDGTMSQEMIYQPEYHNHGEMGEDYNPDQVYGPMWGVPGEAVGMDGYEPFYLMQYLGADPKDIPEEYRADVLRRQAQIEAEKGKYHAENPQHDPAAPAQGAAPAPPAQQKPSESADDSEEARPESDGIKDDSGDWYDG